MPPISRVILGTNKNVYKRCGTNRDSAIIIPVIILRKFTFWVRVADKQQNNGLMEKLSGPLCCENPRQNGSGFLTDGGEFPRGFACQAISFLAGK